MTNEELDGMIRELSGSYNAPPEPPREAMWAEIERSRGALVTPIFRASRATRWLVAAAGVAAVLTVGIAIGRMSRGPAAPVNVAARGIEAPVTVIPPGTAATSAAPSVADAHASPTRLGMAQQGSRGKNVGVRTNRSVDQTGDESAYRHAVMEHLTRTEVLLTTFRSEARGTGDARLDAQFGALTRDLLGTTRLMIATHRNDDPSMTRLMEDLELVLMQISQYANDGRKVDLDAATQSIDKRNVITKLRASIPAGT